MWDLVDVVCPSIYALYKSCDGCNNSAADDRARHPAVGEEGH